MAKAMNDIALNSILRRGCKAANHVCKVWNGGGDYEEEKKDVNGDKGRKETFLTSKAKREREQSYIEEILCRPDGSDGVSKKAKQADAAAMASKIVNGGPAAEVDEEVFSVFYPKVSFAPPPSPAQPSPARPSTYSQTNNNVTLHTPQLKQAKDYHSKNLTAQSHAASSMSGPVVTDAQEMIQAMEGSNAKRLSRPDVDGFDLTALVSDSVTPPTSGEDISRLFNFSGEEVFGKYLDLTDSHLKCLNMEAIFAENSKKKVSESEDEERRQRA